jgi:hypothetical protein
MSVFKKYRGKRIKEDDPDYSKGTWYVWRRVGGTILHKALKGVANELDAKEVETRQQDRASASGSHI